jgi:hypothetical protein
MTRPATPSRCLAAGLLIRAIVGVAAGLASVACCLSATAAEPEKQADESVFKGHRLAAFIDEQTHRATIKLDDRPITVRDGVAEIGKITSVDLVTSFLYYLHLKTTAGCGSYLIVRVALVADPGKSEVLSDFGACNDQLTARLERRQGWAAWYAIAFRDDRATAKVAFIADDKLTTREAKAPPCLFMPAAQQGDCIPSLVAEAAGSGERGLPTGAGAFADQKIATFLNHSTGKATLELNSRAFRTFDNAKEFYLVSVDGEDQFGLFAFFLKPGTGCSTRPLVFFAGGASEPEVITDFAPCTDKMVRQTRKKGNSIAWSAVAFHVGEPRGYNASVIDHKLSTRTTQLPPCMMEEDKAKVASCVLQALGGGPSSSQPPQLRVIPAPPPRASPKPRTLGI